MKKLFGKILALIICAALLTAALLPLPASAYVKATYDDVKNSTTEEMREQLEELDQLLKESKAALEEADRIQADATEKRRIYLTMQALYEDTLKMLESELTVIEKEVEDIAKDIAAVEVEYENEYESFLDILRMTYEEGQTNWFEILMGATSLSDLLSRIDRVTAIIRYSDRVMDSLLDKKTELTEKYEAQLLKIEEQNSRIAEYEARTAELAAWQAENEEVLAAIENEIADLIEKSDSYVERVDVLDAEFQAMVDQLEAEENKKRAEAEERARQAAIAAAEKKRLEEEQARLKAIEEAARNQGFLWPLPSSCLRVSSSYGNRVHPVYGKTQFHYGIDLPAAKGTPIYAAKDGKVTIAKYHVSYGNYVLIDHLDGTSTLYAHMDPGSFKVKAGDIVKRGQQIGGVGTTGVSTGYHLHFEVRVNGNTVDPLKYVKAPGTLTITG
jgi:murein DD-endopeptidase MepM/ murein hydrolase activator NlpD